MTRSHILMAALLALPVMPASAADRPPNPWRAPVAGPAVIYAAPAPVYVAPAYVREPYFVVDQGPEFSGPQITITAITWTDNDVHTPYPYISPYLYVAPPAPPLSARASVHYGARKMIHRRTVWTSPKVYVPRRVAVRQTTIVRPGRAKTVVTRRVVTRTAVRTTFVNKPVRGKPFVNKPFVNKPFVNKPVVTKPPVTKSVVKTGKAAIVKSAVEKSAASETVGAKSAVTKSEVAKSAAAKSPVDKPAAAKAAVAKPASKPAQ